MDYARFLTHVKFAVQRIEEGRLLTCSDSMLYEMVKGQDPISYDCAVAIAGLVRERYDVELPDEEMLYLMVHVNRLRARDGEDCVTPPDDLASSLVTAVGGAGEHRRRRALRDPAALRPA